MKQRTGYVYFNQERKHWVARISWTDSLGKRHNRKQKVANKTEGRKLLKKWADTLEEQGGDKMVDAARLTFRKLGEIYAERKLIAPVIRGAQRVAGMRSYKTQQGFLKCLTEHFGKRKITAITHNDLEAYKQMRLQTKTKHGKERSLAHAHRELSLLRSIFNFAKRQGWLSRTPFEMGSSLINISNEPQRDRLMTHEEETALLEACTGRRTHLRPMLICLVDTGMRRGEMLALEWSDVDLEAGLIAVRGETTKTLRGRCVGITARLETELRKLAETRLPDESRVFVQGSFKRAFASACEKAELENLRVHDLRHTAITRWIQAGMPVAEVMRLAGHRTLNVSYRYINVDDQTARRAADAMDALRQSVESAKASPMVN